IDPQTAGFALPKRVRIYRRGDHFVLQWWDLAAKRTLNHRVEGDVVTAVAKAREIDEKLAALRHSGSVVRRVRLVELVELFVADLGLRANGGEISLASVKRLSSALAHFQRFVAQPNVAKSWPWASQVDRDFRLAFSTFLQNERVAPNCHPHAVHRVLGDPEFVLDACRTLFAWASDPQRGNLLPQGFISPFQRRGASTTVVHDSLVGDPDITLKMAGDFLEACDAFQLSVFSALILFGLRPSEITYLFKENVTDEWVKVVCIPELGYFTKGRRNKQFPAMEPLLTLWNWEPDQTGVLFQRRDSKSKGPCNDLSLAGLANAFDERCRLAGQPTAAAKEAIRDQVVRQAGGLDYDRIEHEFARLAGKLSWPKTATLKDLRHLFGTCLENAGVPEFYRKFLMGHSPGRVPIVSYTHLDAVRRHYQRAIDTEFAPCLNVIERRASVLRPSIEMIAAPD
ncbi:MAG TPA: hypothetical protein VKH44_10050, partial [Pirellulaceae bacterium]|nr:hypothetical protein [Pirellulaceae bacterium]